MGAVATDVLGVIVNLNRPARVVRWHFVQLSVANLAILAVTLVVFALALALPHAASWLYVFGLASIASLAVIVVSGAILTLKGPAWWHYTGVGHFFNSVHLWAVELFFFSAIVHTWGKYWTAAWRGGRARVWATGAIALLVAVPCALTGYLSQQNFDAQWLSTQAKNAINSLGAGAFFNVTNFGQMYSYHVLLLPLATVALVTAHMRLVRRHGLVAPFDADLGGQAPNAPEPAGKPGGRPAPEPALKPEGRPSQARA
jgi:hypothetical protein